MSNEKRPVGRDSDQKRTVPPPPKGKPLAPAEHYLPQEGWFADWQWAEQLGQTVERFRELVRKNGVPAKEWGYMLLVKAEDYWDESTWRKDGAT